MNSLLFWLLRIDGWVLVLGGWGVIRWGLVNIQKGEMRGWWFWWFGIGSEGRGIKFGVLGGYFIWSRAEIDGWLRYGFWGGSQVVIFVIDSWFRIYWYIGQWVDWFNLIFERDLVEYLAIFLSSSHRFQQILWFGGSGRVLWVMLRIKIQGRARFVERWISIYFLIVDFFYWWVIWRFWV
jgi:hypothetical protein